MVEIVRFGGLPVTPWHNGAGRKADIASTADWHVGFAWLDRDAPFSDFSGHDRTITLIDGPGFVLAFADKPALHVAEPYRPAAFDGGWPTQCRLSAGPGLVLNAMTARARHRHTVTVSDAPSEVGADQAQAVFVILLTGAATIGSATMAPLDAVHVTATVPFLAAPGSRVCTIAIMTMHEDGEHPAS